MGAEVKQRMSSMFEWEQIHLPCGVVAVDIPATRATPVRVIVIRAGEKDRSMFTRPPEPTPYPQPVCI